jgi:hypothetical protein
MWIRHEQAFAPIIDQETFAKAHAIIQVKWTPLSRPLFAGVFPKSERETA